jgi:predicted nuclease of predicted toxin-antitoxin system
MEYARVNSMVVLTNDLDFSAILAATKGAKPSVVQIRSVDLSPETVGQAVVSAIKQVETELSEGALLSVDPTRSRLRLLPLV